MADRLLAFKIHALDTFYGQPQDHRPDFDAIAIP